MNKRVLAFDVYGTLIDTHGVVEALTTELGDAEKAHVFSQRWRDKQLEYAFRRSLMGAYARFSDCTREALEFTDRALGGRLSDVAKEHLLDLYTRLPAFPDVDAGLARFANAGVRCVAFSNGTDEAVSGLLSQAGIKARFDAVVSVDDIKRFKPDPAVYAYLRQRTESRAADTWLVSSNPFDIIGAKYAGLHAAWIRRSAEAPFDPWGDEPDMTVSDLDELADRLLQ
ncbi:MULTISPECIES: haloacid dehalogenase type II [Chromohalobacter]|jgi:2-haloacid dehalogenase|uniref:haloacid dehalogenase type II n=1 Tax=Chromohalobacter TaxID=42054 RepID=UPI00054E17EB|nr:MULTISPECIES: haloacid dehalogenase type II [Chromohalobacter]MBZ5875875.1 haloacid dehalogenase type II [Chromohalobacter salexigens]MDF9434068.1 haloacid dehalogenase type II [Chromohalobacter israelensis]MDO0945860.1 haloacid dehalogenase type II [Chromohalobacter salexigens]NWO56236.1 haloacid dehalogenase type II [Chromohalobacter salexigens]PWW42426.1 2-haloacid dehalogenase [Chromohalobacter salexigens]